MRTDLELLEMAAKAAGIDPNWDGLFWQWNPLADDGDALRLAVKLEIQAGYADFSGEGVATWDRGTRNVRQYGPEDPCAATRRAIVHAAAEIAKATKEQI